MVRMFISCIFITVYKTIGSCSTRRHGVAKKRAKEVNDVKEYFGRRRSANNSSNNSGSLTFSGSGALGSLASLLNLLTESVDAAEVISIPYERTQILSYYDCFILCSSQPTHCREVDRAK